MYRDYKDEYAKFQSSSSQKKDRAHRNKMRRLLMRLKRVSKNDKKDIDHRDGNPRNNSLANIRITSIAFNRAKK